MAKFIKPSWLTKSFIKNALCGNGWKIRKDGNWEKCTESNILSIEDLNVNMPVPKGNNFACTIYRANVACRLKDESLKNISLIVKEPLEVDEIKSRSKAGIFQKESIIYDELLPKFQSTFGEKWGEMTPKLFHMNNDHILVLEDLKESGYVMLDRTKLLNFEEGEIALSALAKFHAASAKIYETESELIKKAAREIMFQPDRKDTTMIYWNSFFEGAVNSCLKRPDLIKYAQPLRKFSKNLWDTAQRELKPNKNEFNVLNHGDPWATNMMFKYIHNKPVRVKIIDFQVSRYGSPAFDLIQFMYGTIQEGVRLEKYEQLLKIYLEKLNNALISFGSNERLDKLDLEKAIDKRTFYAVFITITSLPMSIADPAKAEIISKEKNGVRIKSYFENKKYLDIMSKRLEEFETKGWI